MGTLLFAYHFHSITENLTKSSLNILAKKIDERLQVLGQHFHYLNISMLLDRPLSDRSPSITYRCREWCGGWGDRLRGITSTFILAVLTGRRFYIDMPYPCELTRYLKPHLYDWQPIKLKSNRSQLHIDISQNSRLARAIYENISSADFNSEWSRYDDIYLSSNSDYITSALANKHLQSVVRRLNISSIESTQVRLFPLLYELLFRPTDAVTNLVDQVLNQVNTWKNQLICLHIRLGKNPTMVHDEMLAHRDTMVEDMLDFVERNFTDAKNALLFVTSDSMQVNDYIRTKYPSNQSMSIPGPIIHIDRLSPSYSSAEQCQGFLKVIADFYVLGECDRLIMPRSGFSQWASRRRCLRNQFDQLYLYCRGVHRITGHEWKRPHTVC